MTDKYDNIKYETLVVSPERAKELLANMAPNRNLKRTRVTTYASDMEKGRWYLSPQPICFNEEGQLVDGQHRLKAVVKSGKTITFKVATNVPKDTPLDENLTRSTADSLRCRGKIDAEVATRGAVAVVNAFFKIKLRSPDKIAECTEEDRAVMLNKYKDEIVLSRQIVSRGTSHPILTKAGCQCGVLMALLNGIDRDLLFEFGKCVNTGFYTNESQKSAIALRNTLYDYKISGSVDIITLDSVTEQAIQDFVNEIPRKQRYTATNKFPFSHNISLREVIR